MTETTQARSQRPSTEFLDRPGGRIAYEVVGTGPLVIPGPGAGPGRGWLSRGHDGPAWARRE